MAITYPNGYTPQTTVLSDFKKALHLGKTELRSTFDSLMNEFGDNWVYLAEMNLALGAISKHLYDKKNIDLFKFCLDLYVEVCLHADKVLKGEDRSNYFSTVE